MNPWLAPADPAAIIPRFGAVQYVGGLEVLLEDDVPNNLREALVNSIGPVLPHSERELMSLTHATLMGYAETGRLVRSPFRDGTRRPWIFDGVQLTSQEWLGARPVDD